MLVKAHLAARSLARLDPAVRLYLFGGPDETASRALRDRVVAAIGSEAERVDLNPEKVRDDPAIIADEAASISLFGGRRWVSVSVASGNGDELVPAIENLLSATAAGNPVVVTVAGLTGKSRLTKLAEKDPQAIAVISYLADVKDVGPLAQALAEPLGLTLTADVVRAIAQASGGESGLIAREIEKLALYCDAAPDNRKRAALPDWQAIGADIDDAQLGETINATFGGLAALLPRCLAELDAVGAIDIRLVRAMMARAHLLARLRVAVDGGISARQVVASQGKAIFWKDADAVVRQLERWNARQLARAITRLHGLERDLKAPDNPGSILVQNALLQFARVAA